jgi:hypothetical protein
VSIALIMLVVALVLVIIDVIQQLAARTVIAAPLTPIACLLVIVTLLIR